MRLFIRLRHAAAGWTVANSAEPERLAALLREAADRIEELEREAESAHIEIDQLQEALAYAANPEDL